MKSRKKSLKSIFIYTLVLALLGTMYVHFGIFPGQSRLYAIEKISQLTQKKVSFDKAVWMPFHGLIFYNLDVREKDGALLFTSKRLGLDIKIVPFLREKKIILNNVLLDEPVCDLVLQPRKIRLAQPAVKTELSGQIKVPTIDDEKKIGLDDITGGPEMLLPENVYIEQIQIMGGQLTLRRTENEAPIEMLRDINVRLIFRRPPFLRFDGSLKLGDNIYATVNLTGVWDLSRAAYEFNLLTEWEQIPSWLTEYQKNNFLILQESRVKLSADLRSVGEDKALFYADADLQDTYIRIRDSGYRGQFRVKAKGLFNFLTKKMDRYKGSLDLLDVEIANLSPRIQLIESVQGAVDFQPDLLTVRSFKGLFAQVPFNAAGTITSFHDLLIKGRVYTSVPINMIMALIPEDQKRIIKDIDISGDCQALTLISGSLKKQGAITAQHKMALRNGTLLSRDKRIKASGIFCDLSSDESGLKISNAHFSLGEKKYRLELFVPKKHSSPGSVDLSTENLSLKASYTMREGHIQIDNALASLPGVSARFGGTLYPLATPVLDIKGRASANLTEALRPIAAKLPWLKEWPLHGTLNGDFSYKGPWNNLDRSQATLSASASSIWIKKMRLANVGIDASANNSRLDISHMTAEAYRGMLGLKGFFSLDAPGTPFGISLYANNLDMHLLALDLWPENNKLSGDLILQLALAGRLNHQESYTGQGAVSIKKGYIMETTQFKAMGQLPLVRVEGLDLVVFNDLSAPFQIHDGKIWTDRLILISDTVHLDLSGSISFSQDLDMMMDIQYTNAVFLGAQDAGGLAPMMVNQAQDLISQYRVSGKIKNPRYDKVGVPVANTVGKKISDLIQGLAS